MKTKHTPGPWKWTGTKRDPDSNCYLVSETAGTNILFLPNGYISPADSKLIMASPEMADVLERICKFTGYTHEIFGVEESIADSERFSALMAEGRQVLSKTE